MNQRTRSAVAPFTLAAAVLILCCLTNVTVAAEDTDGPSETVDLLGGEALVEALQQGGYILYFRHGLTDHNTYDSDRNNLDNCASQRLLSDEGRQQMQSIGTAIKQLNIPISKVISSPYCRAIDTAVLAFGHTIKDENLKHTVTASKHEAEQQSLALKTLLSTRPTPQGTNTVLSGHTGNLQEATGIWPKPEGVAIVFKPHGAGGFHYVATIPPEYWSMWLADR